MKCFNKSLIILLLFIAAMSTHAMETLILEINNQPFYLEVPFTAEEFTQGLMFRKHLEKNHGMIFLFDPKKEKTVQMWMKNTYLPLDMLFIDANYTIVCAIENVRPLSLERINCGNGIAAVIELNAGDIKMYHLVTGMSLIGH